MSKPCSDWKFNVINIAISLAALQVYSFVLFQLDENLEQWPHLHELVQCYTADWIKDENKYGHYESTHPITFQNQIYEGPDTDTETGMMYNC